ncbi:Fasciculation and elongation protein zeta-2 [Nymphon striatum]|nr:Fasciculation and elongation protein zeta-2 [Nymphon striatum]
MCPACTNVWVKDLGNYRYPVEKIGKCPTQYGKKDPRYVNLRDVNMRDVKMAELKVEAPLAMCESEDWLDFNEFQSSEDIENSNKDTITNSKTSDNNEKGLADNFSETFSGSLEDLVNTFDEKITKCFCDYDESVENLAPVQVRTQDEIMNECQMWWTITGNFGNILPIDWTKSYARKLHMPTLNLNEKKDKESLDEFTHSEDEDVAKDLDLHSLIISSLQQEPMFTAEEVLEQIDEIMQESTESIEEDIEHSNQSSPDKSTSHASELKNTFRLSSPLYEQKLKDLGVGELNELYLELEGMIKEYSETLIQQLALRDELEYEKELKNSFISLLLSVQNKRRQFNLEKKKRGKAVGPNGIEYKYLTTVIPYQNHHGPPSNQTLQILIKILQAINEDNPAVATLLTDYILKGEFEFT